MFNLDMVQALKFSKELSQELSGDISTDKKIEIRIAEANLKQQEVMVSVIHEDLERIAKSFEKIGEALESKVK